MGRPLLLAFAACALTHLPAPGRAEEFIYLGSGPLLGDRARQLRATQVPGADWNRPERDDSSWQMPEGAPPGGGLAVPDGGTPSPCGTLYLRRRFDVGPEISRLASLHMRLRYEDGFAAYLNGVEVARRRLPGAAQTDALTLATDRGGREPETYFIPLAPGMLRERDNLLAIEVHARAPERCPRLDLELGAADSARAARGPYIESVSENEAMLSVESDVPTRIELRYGKGPSRQATDRKVVDDVPATLHRVRLTGLRAASIYHYQLSLRLPSGATTDLPEAAFHTPPRAGRPLSFVVYGDSRSGHEVHAQLVESVIKEAPDLVFITGDVVERGTEEGDWDRFFQVAAPLLRSVAVYIVPGNHEYARRGQGARRLFELFATMFTKQTRTAEREGVPRHLLAVPAPPSEDEDDLKDRGYYSFDVAGVHFVVLDSNQYRSARQKEWLEEDLAQAGRRAPRAIFVLAHEGPYSSGWHGDNGEAIRTYVPILEQHNVTLMFSGHDHDYERGRRGRLSYVVTGGGGAELRPVRCGVPGKRRCKYPPHAFFNEHNYVRVEVLPGLLRLCPKRIDGTPLERCQITPLPR